MAFNNDKAIYLQIADRLSDEILAGVYKAFDRVPSMREYAARLGVNANTAVKAYEQLAQEGVIFNKRGLGYFVAEDAQQYIKATRRNTFLKTVLPEVVRQMKLLDITMDDIRKAYASVQS
ncbi:GntR family transcriptional regulator [Hallella multisaccharivorax DSM 17128]|uniref:Transcriptional regulator, GntR family n=1 Tax=Hallella multisaccharivorax DSM 17128 TaxID=688246 RepID=F8N856_9BACT|nr:GntR family transcriptional regulator [Hallella multisaccharivorax]EGN56494.1 transcriptional regulator, GntR family [Hallella multisaccharivorax DSM 17128]GJG30025.1 GntR family transcriptional regulator [Hallella multisaccharivorax DSM 17128]